MSSYHIIRKSEQLTTAWAGGTTIQLAIHPVDASLAERNFAWRLSSATVTQAGEFSQFRGYGRWLGLRQGAGLNLTVDQQQMQLKAPQHMLWFSGDANTSAELIAGNVVDINLILAAGWQGGMQALTLNPQVPQSVAVPAIAQEIIFYLDAGEVVLTIEQKQVLLNAGEVFRCQLHEVSTKNWIVQSNANQACAVLAWVAAI